MGVDKEITIFVLKGAGTMAYGCANRRFQKTMVSRRRDRDQPVTALSGFTLTELMIVIAIMATLAAIAVPLGAKYIDRARTVRAIEELRMIEHEITWFDIYYGRLPNDLSEMNMHTLKDPWGGTYQYTNFALTKKGKWRKDKFLVPINSTYDLWSMGPDGDSKAPLTAKASRDDIIRANDGGYFGKAALY